MGEDMIEKNKAERVLLKAAAKAGLEITPELKNSVDELATAYTRVIVENKKLAESYDKARKAARK